jgi:hypothetical protein
MSLFKFPVTVGFVTLIQLLDGKTRNMGWRTNQTAHSKDFTELKKEMSTE